MASTKLDLTVKTIKETQKVVVEMDVNRFERLAAGFGLFREEFLESLDKAEQELALAKTKILKSLKSLRVG